MEHLFVYSIDIGSSPSVYKGSTLGRQYSWNNIIKRIDYEQDRGRTIILETNNPERGTVSTSEKNSNSATAYKGKTKPISERHIKAAEQPKSYLEKAQSDGLKSHQMDDHPWNTFKLELDSDSRFKKRKWKRKGRKR